MTIHELLQAAGLTANDEIPIWDAEATGEPTKKITAQQLAAAVVALANLVTGVKGNAESSYRTGNVNITPANIGAVSTSAVIDITHGGTGATDPAGARANLELTPSASQTIATGIFIMKIGSLAFIYCGGQNVIALPSRTWVTLGYLPNGYVPSDNFYGTILNGNQVEQSGLMFISREGAIQYYNSGTAQTTALWGSIIFPISNN
jgi:hypothetical protein